MAGNLSVETCGNVFQSRKASSNYGVDSIGNIGMYVEESDRSWCSSNGTNDNRAITIEVADCNNKWEVNDVAMARLIELVVDCCKRNKIKKLVWSSNKYDRVNHLNGCNMTVHRDFSSTTCPGDWLYSKMPYIASEVNKRLIPSIDEAKVGEFIERLYKNTLNRGSDASGMAYWLGRAKDGASGADLAYGFLLSPEFIKNSSTMTPTQYVELLYRTFFNRNSDPTGLKHWTDLLYTGVKREIIIDGFIGSAEWRNLCRTYGIEPCR